MVAGAARLHAYCHASGKIINRFFKGKGIEGVTLMTGYFTGGEPLVSRMYSLRLPVALPHAV